MRKPSARFRSTDKITPTERLRVRRSTICTTYQDSAHVSVSFECKRALHRKVLQRNLVSPHKPFPNGKPGLDARDIGTLPLIANVLETTIDSLFSEDVSIPDITSAPIPATVPVPGEVIPVYQEEPESIKQEGTRVVFSNANLVCISNMTPDTIDGLTVHFPDGSSADLKTRTIVNYGGGIIRIQEAPQARNLDDADLAAALEETISRQVIRYPARIRSYRKL